MHAYEELKSMLCKELEEITKEGEIKSLSTLDEIDKLTHSIKSLATIMAMEDGGYSRDDGSYARGRSVMTGRYISRDRGYSSRYSRDDHSAFAEQLEELMESAPNEKIRNQLRKTMSDVNNNV